MKPLVLMLLAILIPTISASADNVTAAQDDSADVRELVREIKKAIAQGDWSRLAGGLDPSTIRGIESSSAVLGLDRAGVMKLLYACRHPARRRQDVRCEPVPGVQDVYRIVLTQPYTAIDEPMEHTPDCGTKPVELCVRAVRGDDGKLRLELTYDLHDLIYLLQ